ncbi:MAG TPA: phage holin family protein [Thermoleophilaceae bacterium]
MASTGTHSRERDGRSLGELTKQLTRDISAMVRSEVMLAKVEVSARARVLAGGAAMLAVAVIFGLTAFVCVVTAAVAALSLVVEVWLAALIVAAVAAMLAGGLALFGVRAVRSASPPLPVETMESAKEDVAWVKAHARQPGAK